MMARRFLALLRLACCLAVAPAMGQITILPASPTPMDVIRISKPYGNEDPTLTGVWMSGNHIVVSVRRGDIPQTPPGTFVQAIGRLPAGVYQVDVVNADFGPAAPLGSATFTVAPRAAGQPVDDYTDIWWNPDESGWGINIVQHADGQIFATWLAYAADGTPTWYVVPGGAWKSALFFQGDIYRTTGPDMLQFTPAAVTRTKVGSASFLFTPSGLRIDFEIDGTQVVKTLQRQSF